MTEYPLKQLATIKQKRLEEAEKTLFEKKQLLAKEEAKLAELKKKHEEAKALKEAKLEQYREEIDSGTTTDKIQQMRHYLKLVTEACLVEENKVVAQQKVVDAALQQVESAKEDLFKKQKAVEKMGIHKEEWDRDEKKAEELKMENENDEIGGARYTRNKRH